MMNRIPIAGAGPIPNKNGYRVTPPPPTVYDPAAAAAYANANHQRFMYNGQSMPQGTVPYSGQMVFVSIFQINAYPQLKNTFCIWVV